MTMWITLLLLPILSGLSTAQDLRDLLGISGQRDNLPLEEKDYSFSDLQNDVQLSDLLQAYPFNQQQVHE